MAKRTSAAIILAMLVGPCPVVAKVKTHRVTIAAMAYGQPNLLVAPGDMVVWTNDDIVPHTVTGSGFDSGSIPPGKSWQRAFTTTGVVKYRCAFHPSMTATLNVR